MKTNINIYEVADFLQTNINICSPSRKDMSKFNGNIIIHNDVISFIDKDKKVILSRTLDSNILKEQISNIVFKNNLFRTNCKDIKCSPFEQDDSENESYFVNGMKKGIDFPKFASVIMATLLLYGIFPTFMEYAKIYTLAYTQCVSAKDEKIDFTKHLIGFSGQWSDIDKRITYPTGETIINKVIRFTDKVWNNGHVTNFSFNQFTTEMLFCRLFKAYGSVVRDPYHILRLHTLTNLPSDYSIIQDYGGSDGESLNYKIRAFVNSARAHKFGNKKVTERRRELPDNRVELHIDIKEVNDLKVLTDESIIQIGEHIKKDKGLKIVQS